MKGLLWLAVGLLSAGSTQAQKTPCPLAGAAADPAAAQRCMYFSMERFGVEVPAYTIMVRGDGKALYWESANLYGGAPGQMAWLPVSDATEKAIFAAEPAVRGGTCSSHVTNLPMGGKKKLVAWSQDGSATCAFSSSQDAAVSAADAAFEGIAETLQAGKRLAREHAHERLALPDELDALTAKVQAGKAIEVGMIAATLQALIDDDLVVDVVKTRARALLGK